MPKRLQMGMLLKLKFLKVVENRADNTLTISVRSRDSTFSELLLGHYLDFLNIYLQENVRKDASANIDYLRRQLDTISDPLLRDKLQTLMANEMEKMMLVSREAFRVVDPPYRQTSFKMKRQWPIFGGLAFLVMGILAILIGHALNSVRSPEDQRFIDGIKAELFSFSGFFRKNQ